MILSGPEIERVVRATAAAKENGYSPALPAIEITPFDPTRCGPNSYDVTLDDTLLVYRSAVLDCRDSHPTETVLIPERGLILLPGELYLGSTVERTACSGLVPWLDGRSSIGRLGIQIHSTAGRGDDGFGEVMPGGCSWTLELTVTKPVRVYPNLRIGQLTFIRLAGERKGYRGRYADQAALPVASRLGEGV